MLDIVLNNGDIQLVKVNDYSDIAITQQTEQCMQFEIQNITNTEKGYIYKKRGYGFDLDYIYNYQWFGNPLMQQEFITDKLKIQFGNYVQSLQFIDTIVNVDDNEVTIDFISKFTDKTLVTKKVSLTFEKNK